MDQEKNMKNLLIIDCQLLQTNALHRGMGKYTTSVLKEYLFAELPYDKVVVLLSDQKVTIEDEKLLEKSLQSFEIVRLPLLKTEPSNPEGYRAIVEKNRQTIDKYINTKFSKWNVDFFITSMFQGDGCSAFPTKSVNRYLLVYDLIPLQFPDYYLKDHRGRVQYLSRYRELFNANHYFAISNTVANDIALNLGIPIERITPIDGSYVSRKSLKKTRPSVMKEIERFILMPTGDDARKNNLRATIAFEEFNTKQSHPYKLVMTSFFGDKTKNELRQQSKNIVFTGNVSEEELAWLYGNADLIFFPSEYEGLGMPALEAVEFNKPVLCSAIDVFKEISEKAFIYCNPYDVMDMSEKLQVALNSVENLPSPKEYLRILNEYSWRITAQRTIDVYSRHSRHPIHNHERKRKIAVFAPNPSGYSAIGKIVQEQHYELSGVADVDYFLDCGITEKAKHADIRMNYLPYVARCSSPWSMNEKEFIKYDQVVYHIGNSEYHVASTIKALAFPGTVVLHDTRLREMFEVIKNQGYISEPRFRQEAILQTKIMKTKGIEEEVFKSDHIAAVVNSALKVIVHSDYAAEATAEALVSKADVPKIIKIDLPTPVPYAIYTTNRRDNNFIVGCAGVIHQAKGLDIINDLLSQRLKRKISIKLFGYSLLSDKMTSELKKYNIEMITSPTDTRFMHEIENCDVVLGFRPDYHGETSLSTLEALRLGKAVVVNDIGWFKEIPSSLVYKVSNRADIPDAINSAILREAPELARQRNCYVKNKHSIKGYVTTMVLGVENDLV